MYVRSNRNAVFRMARQFVDHGTSRQEIDRLLQVFSRLDDASIEDERLAALSDADRGSIRPRARLSEPVLKQESVQTLLNGARQSRAFSKRLHTESLNSHATSE
jgi:hypothetical protein